MKKKGFTLIELLVVVLIIGILASVALSQYQRAVDKTRIMGAFQLARSIKMAEEEYYLANSSYTDKQEDLSLQVGDDAGGSFSKNGFEFSLKKGDVSTIPASVYAADQTLGVLLIVSFDKSYWKGASKCYASIGKERAQKACRSFTGLSEPSVIQSNYWVYDIAL